MSRLSIGKAWDEARATLASNRKLLIPVALGLVLLPAVITAMVEPRPAAGEQPPAGPWMLVALVMVMVMLIGQLAIVMLVSGWRDSVGAAIAKAAKRVPTFILAALCFLVPVVLAVSIILAVSGASATGGGEVDWTNFSGPGWLLMLGALAAILYFSIRFMPLIAVIACEEVGPIAALKRCFALTSGSFWRLFTFLMVLMIAFLVVALVVGSVFGAAVTLLFGEPQPWSLGLLLLALVSGLVQVGFVLVYTAMLARIYAQLAAPRAGVPEVGREGK